MYVVIYKLSYCFIIISILSRAVQDNTTLGKQTKQNACSKSVTVESETETKRRTFLHVLVLLKQVSGCVDVVRETNGGKMLLSAFHLARKLQR